MTDAKRKVDYAWDAPRAVTNLDVLLAVETLLLAGHLVEAHTVLCRVFKNRVELRDALVKLAVHHG